MNRRWLVISLAVAAVVALWILGSGRVATTALTGIFSSAPPAKASGKTKPICSQVIVPAGDCIPQHLANLPPDPGPEGMKTIEGIDSDKDGVRDDVQRFIVENYGHSERAVRALREVAKATQRQVALGDSVNRDQAKAVVEEIVMKGVTCFSRSVDDSIRRSDALQLVVIEVTNTPERFSRKKKFEVMAGNRVYESSRASLQENCGYDPAQLAN